MSGLWLKSGMHFNITHDGAKEIAEQFRKDGRAFWCGEEVEMVLPVKEGPVVKLRPGKLIKKNRRESKTSSRGSV